MDKNDSGDDILSGKSSARSSKQKLFSAKNQTFIKKKANQNVKTLKIQPATNKYKAI